MRSPPEATGFERRNPLTEPSRRFSFQLGSDRPLDLSQPVSRFLRPVEPLRAEDSLLVAGRRLGQEALPSLPVASDGFLVGSLSQRDLMRALAEGASVLDPVQRWMAEALPALGPHASAAEALRSITEANQEMAIVVDGQGHVLGCVVPSELLGGGVRVLRPRSVGGMATPFGVYLTNGTVTGGASHLAVVATGMVLFLLLFLANLATLGVHTLIQPLHWSGQVQAWVLGATALALFLLGIRLIPLSGTHAAEHMVVHAIERGEPLVPEVVKRMPRVHPRCGTNIAAGASLFLGLATSDWIPDQQLRLLLAALVTLTFWRPLGALLQYFVTTKPPTDRQILDGIRAGEQLLRRVMDAPVGPSPLLVRVMNSGLVQIMVGSMLMYYIIQLIGYVFGVREPWLVYF